MPSRTTADDSAVKLVCMAELFYTLPILGLILYNLGNPEFWVWAVVGLGYGFLLNFVNEKHFIKGGELKRLKELFKNESKAKSTIGFAIVIGVWLFSLVFLVIVAKLGSRV